MGIGVQSDSMAQSAFMVGKTIYRGGHQALLRQIFVMGMCLLFLMACRQNDEPDATATVMLTTAVPPPTSTPTATVAITPTSTPQPTPVVPYIAVADQSLTDTGILTITSAASPAPGWVVLYTMQEGDLGAVLGYTAVNAGINADLHIQIDPLRATPLLAAILHVDAGVAGEFEFPDGPDEPVQLESGVIAAQFSPEFELSLPVISAADQEILEDGLVHLESVVALAPGWLVLHADAAGTLGPYLGSAPITAGRNENLHIHIPWRQGTTTLYAVIYEDNGRPQQLDLPGDDTPFLANGSPVITPFTVTYPPDLYVLDQPVIDGRFEVERVYSNGPGWLVVYFDNDGVPGLIIGQAPLANGVNEQVVVEVLPAAVTNPLYLRVHEDSEPGDAFDFPRVDPPILYQGRQVLPYSVNIEPGSYLTTRDQALAMGTENGASVIVPLVVVDQPAWVAVHADVSGQLGEILGVAPLQPGINREVVVEIEAESATVMLHAALYIDAGQIGDFEYPGGADTPVQRNRRTLSVPFMVLE